jgi:restriction endonuclease Mrr
VVFIVVAVAVLLGFVLIALLGQAPARAETLGAAPMGLSQDDAWLARLGPEELEKLLVLVFSEMKFELERRGAQEGTVDLWAVNATPITGMRVYVRGIPAPPLGVVGEEEVRAAIETARAEQAGKAIVVTPGGFSPEARAAAAGASADLVDGAALGKLVRKHLPQVAAEKHV